MRKNIAIVLAGGIGSRLGLSIPKQFFKVAGKMVVEHTIDAFESNPHIDEIAIVSNPFYIADFESIIIKNGWKKVKKILKGGQERFHSSLSAIKAYEGSDVNLIFHDAVRPLVSQRILNDVIKALETYAAIDVAMPATDTIIEVDGDFIHQIPDRSKLKRGQTPQAFHLETILGTANTNFDIAQTLSSKVDHPTHLYFFRVDIQTSQAAFGQLLIIIVRFMLHTSVQCNHCQIMGVGNIIDVAGQSQGKFCHGNQKRIPTTGSGAFNIHGRPAGRLTQTSAYVHTAFAKTFNNA